MINEKATWYKGGFFREWQIQTSIGPFPRKGEGLPL